MSRSSLAAGLAVLLAVSMLLALAPVSAHPSTTTAATASSSREAAEPAAAITFTILNGYGVPTTHFYLGAVDYGTVFFLVTDPLDAAVNVTITDVNAVRDGVHTPAFQYTATLNATTHSFDSFSKGVSYSFPTNVPYAGTWDVNFSAPNGGTVGEAVTLTVYSVALSTTVGTGATLPGQGIGVFWTLSRVSNGGTLYTGATNVTIYGSYTSNGTVLGLFAPGGVALTPAAAGHGE